MRRRTAVSIHDDLAPSQAAIAIGAANHEFARGVHVEFAIRAHPAFGQNGFHNRAQHALDFGLFQRFFMLRGHNDGGRTNRLAIHIAQSHLAFRIRQQPGHGLVLGAAERADMAQNFMCIIQRRRHQFRRFAAGITEHDALVARAFILIAGSVHALGDMRRLGMQMAFNIGMLPMKAFLFIADVMDREPRQMDQIFRRDFPGAAHFARQHHAIGGDQRFAGDAGIGISGQECVQHRIGNAVRHLIWMAFGNGFRGEKIFAGIAHGLVRPLVAGFVGLARRCSAPDCPGRSAYCRGGWRGQGRAGPRSPIIFSAVAGPARRDSLQSAQRTWPSYP